VIHVVGDFVEVPAVVRSLRFVLKKPETDSTTFDETNFLRLST